MKAFLGFFTRNLLTEFVFALWHPQNQTTASPAPTERDTLILLLLKCYNDDNLKVQICVCVRARGGGGSLVSRHRASVAMRKGLWWQHV